MKYSFKTALSFLYVALLVAVIFHSSNALPVGVMKTKVLVKTPVSGGGSLLADTPEMLQSMEKFKLFIQKEQAIVTSLVTKKTAFPANQPKFANIVNKTLDYWNNILLDIKTMEILKLANEAQSKTPGAFVVACVNVLKYGTTLQKRTLEIQSLNTEYIKREIKDEKDAIEVKEGWLKMLKTVCYVQGTKLPLRFIGVYKQFADGLSEYAYDVLQVSGSKVNDKNQLYFKTWSKEAQELNFCIQNGPPKTAIAIIDRTPKVEMELEIIVGKIAFLIDWFATHKPKSQEQIIATSPYGKNITTYGNYLHNAMVSLHEFFGKNIVQF